MTKVIDNKLNYQNKPPTQCLDTLAQLSTNRCKCLKDKQLTEQKTLQKRARAKSFTNSYLFDLIDLKSSLNKSYWQTFHCSKVILQEGKKITSRYCNQRWCLTCNRIRTAKMINGYSSPLSKFKEPQFVTLTIKNVKGVNLKASIELMNDSLKDIRKNLKKTYGKTLKGLRKYECTYNEKRDDFHPHFHLITDDLETSNLLVDLWLKKHLTADRKAQDITKANDGTMVELCKYFTKVISKDNDYNPKALDVMFMAAKGKRTFQPIGIKKIVSEDIEEIQSQEITFKEPQNQIWVFDKGSFDWSSADGELFSGYEPTKEDFKVINQEYKTDNYV